MHQSKNQQMSSTRQTFCETNINKNVGEGGMVIVKIFLILKKLLDHFCQN